MKLALVCIAALTAAAFVLPTASSAADTCVNYAYVADYHWYYVCADPKDTSCVVSTKEQHGATVTEECYGVDVSIQAVCAPFTGDLDHQWRYCVSGNTRCPAYQEYRSGARNCLP